MIDRLKTPLVDVADHFRLMFRVREEWHISASPLFRNRARADEYLKMMSGHTNLHYRVFPCTPEEFENSKAKFGVYE